MLKHSRIITRLSLGFSLVLLGTLLLGAIGVRDAIQLRDLTRDIFRHPLTVISHIHQVRSEYLVAQMALASITRIGTPAEAEKLHQQLLEQGRINDHHLAVVRERYLGNPEDVQQIHRSLAGWRNLREEIVALMRNGRRAEAVALYEARAIQSGDAVLRDIKTVIDFAAAKAAGLEQAAERTGEQSLRTIALMLAVIMAFGIALALLITRGITRPLAELRTRMTRLAAGDLRIEVPFRDAGNELGAIAAAVQVLKEAALRLESQRWIKASTGELATALQSAADARDFARIVVAKLVPWLEGGAGVFYQRDPDGDTLRLLGSWGLKPRPHMATSCKLGESLVGQCALERRTIILSDVPDDYLRIASGTGEAAARTILVAPVIPKDRVTAVLEIAAFQAFSAAQRALLDEALPIIALTFEVLQRSENTRSLLERTQRQAEDLRASEEELRSQSEQIQASNEELRASEEELKVQREELQAANEELAENARVLEAARRESDRRALELGTASRYKSEFVANMSHELRTPLNSLLILARCLSENEEGNLQPDQVDAARVIEESGAHLLRLINDILDLSKVEAGKMELHATAIPLAQLGASLLRRFRRLAEAKGLELTVSAEPRLPAAIMADAGKVDQILNNLVDNALKFTDHGSVGVHMAQRGQQLAIEIVDTGIGIPGEKIDSIFRAFEQVDGSASRRYGGTGLGLSISRKLAQLMGGDVTVSSAEGKGSRFLFLLPLAPADRCATAEAPKRKPAPAAVPVSSAAASDDRDSLLPNDEIMLIVEDDPSFARIVRDLARKQGFKCLIGGNGKAGLDLARRYRPTGIILDVGLPGIDGWSVMEQLKKQPETRHIPVHFMSAADSGRRGLEMGAVGYFTKPVTKEQITEAFDRIQHFAAARVRRLLLVNDDHATRKAVTTLLATEDLEIVEVDNGEQAFARLRDGEPFDCMVLDLGLPGIDAHGLLQRCDGEDIQVPPVVLYSAHQAGENGSLGSREYSDSIVVKGARSPDRLIDEVTLFLHSVHARLPEAQQRMLRGRTNRETGAEGRLVLVVDDDMRNTFALSKLLRAKGMRVVMAENGRTALDQLEAIAGIDVVLMDIMMPGMDGYQAIREIRKQERFRSLPVIALTARAMLGDREKCLEAGADGYVSKPVDIDELVAAINQLASRVTQ